MTCQPDRHVSDLLEPSITYEEYRAVRQRLDEGWDDAKEAFTRKSNYAFLKRLAKELKLDDTVLHTAVVLVETYYARRAYAHNDRYLIAGAAMFIASKAMDSPRPIPHVALAWVRVKFANKPNPEKRVLELQLAEQMLLAERAILYTTRFDLRSFWLRANKGVGDYLRMLGIYTLRSGPAQQRPLHEPPPNTVSHEEASTLSSLALNFMNMTFRTNLCVFLRPEVLSQACVHAAAERKKITLVPCCDAALTDREVAWRRMQPEDLELLKKLLLPLYQDASSAGPQATEQPATLGQAAPAPAQNGPATSQPTGVAPGPHRLTAALLKPPPPVVTRPTLIPPPPVVGGHSQADHAGYNAPAAQEQGAEQGAEHEVMIVRPQEASPTDPQTRALYDRQNNANNTPVVMHGDGVVVRVPVAAAQAPAPAPVADPAASLEDGELPASRSTSVVSSDRKRSRSEADDLPQPEAKALRVD